MNVDDAVMQLLSFTLPDVPYFFGYKTEFFPSKTIQKI